MIWIACDVVVSYPILHAIRSAPQVPFKADQDFREAVFDLGRGAAIVALGGAIVKVGHLIAGR